MILCGTGSVWSGTGWYWRYWVNMEHYWLIHDGTWSVEGRTGWYLVEEDQYGVVLVIYDGTRS